MADADDLTLAREALAGPGASVDVSVLGAVHAGLLSVAADGGAQRPIDHDGPRLAVRRRAGA